MNSVAHIGKFALASSALFVCVGCLGTETGNPSETRSVSLAMVLKSSNSTVAQCSTEEPEDAPLGLTIDNAWLATNYVSLLGCMGDSGSRIDQSAWNLMRPVARSVATIEPSFCGFDFKTQVADATLGALPAQFAGSSMWLTATRPDGVRVVIQSPVILNVNKGNASSPITSSKVVIAIDAADWLANINFSALRPGSDGAIHVSPTSNVVQLHVFEGQTSSDVVLRTEANDDGVTDD